jgi:protein-tyrosine phosphatase
VIDLALEERPAQLGREIVYCRFPLIDGPGNPEWLLRVAIDTATQFVRNSVTTLVACSGGMSRSPSIVAAVLSTLHGRDPTECLLEVVRDQPHAVSPALWADVERSIRSK